MMTAEMEEYQTLTRCQKVKKILPKVLPLLLLSVILPTADVGTDLALITKLYKGVTACVNGDEEEYWNCVNVGPDKYCSNETVSNKNNTVCGLKDSSDSPYFCRHPSDFKDYKQCEAQGVDKYCSDPASNHNVCDDGTHPKMASSLLFFLLLNYVMGLVTCIRLEGRKWVPLITALFNVYPQYCRMNIKYITLLSRIMMFSCSESHQIIVPEPGERNEDEIRI